MRRKRRKQFRNQNDNRVLYEDDEGMEESGDYEYSGDFYEEGSSDKSDGGVQKPGQFFLVETKENDLEEPTKQSGSHFLVETKEHDLEETTKQSGNHFLVETKS